MVGILSVASFCISTTHAVGNVGQPTQNAPGQQQLPIHSGVPRSFEALRAQGHSYSRAATILQPDLPQLFSRTPTMQLTSNKHSGELIIHSLNVRGISSEKNA